MKRILAVLPLALALTIEAHAESGLAGKWEGTTSSGPSAGPTLQETGAAKPTLTGRWEGQTPNGMSLSLDLVAKGQALSGTLSREGEATPISEGTVTKDGFSFKATLGGETETIEGTVDGDQMKAWLTRQGPERAAVLKRVKR